MLFFNNFAIFFSETQVIIKTGFVKEKKLIENKFACRASFVGDFDGVSYE